MEIRVIEMHKAIEEKMLGIIDKFKEYIEGKSEKERKLVVL